MLLLVNLPDVIIKHLQSFLSNDDFHYFLNSNKCHFSSLKKETVYFSLNREKSRDYVEDERFREMILRKVKDRSKQIGLTFDSRYEIPDLGDIMVYRIDFDGSYPHLLKNVPSQHHILPHEVEEVPFLPILQDLELANCKSIKNFSSLSHLKKLELYDATQLTDITPLHQIPHLTFSNCPNIENFSVLSNKRLESLSLNRSRVSDVSFLRNMSEVSLYLCPQLVDVSPLYGIKTLLLSSCSSIEDISCLGNHHRLTILNCKSIQRGYECFRTVRHARITRSVVPDLSVFREVKSLGITFFHSMERQLFLLNDIPDLSFNADSDRSDYGISRFRNTRLIYQNDIIKLDDSSFPSQLRYLELLNSSQLVKIINEGKTSIFRHLQSLHIRNCSMEHVNGLGDIPTVILDYCFKLHDISGLGRNRCVELRECSKILDVSSLATVPIVTVRNCEGIVDYSCLASVARLKIVRRL